MLLCSCPPVLSASLPPFSSPNKHNSRRKLPPILISTNPVHLDLLRLRDLLMFAGHSCHRFPVLDGEGRVEPIDPVKLRKAVCNSFIVVSVFCRSRFLPSAAAAADVSGKVCTGEVTDFGLVEFLEKAARTPSPDHHLVGFGRAVSDGGLTASIHDVVVMPSLQRRGIGRKIVERIIRVLTNKGIYDISVLCSKKER
ncbi:hypothetical protein HPP92_019762 [Vanilla planifolia]|uniref:N-acetyltransferase domain-containing protein n=1 Tax=Vanilla planifolia TaxID=51239 RepID=A0A835Q2W3_VANPL|nr:hypothetical protein HPP92_019762 [Vanilla planifolia]